MKVANVKVRTPSIPSRTAANQFIDQHGYDMEWVEEWDRYIVVDVEKNKLHFISGLEVTNHTAADIPDAVAWLADFRTKRAALRDASFITKLLKVVKSHLLSIIGADTAPKTKKKAAVGD